MALPSTFVDLLKKYSKLNCEVTIALVSGKEISGKVGEVRETYFEFQEPAGIATGPILLIQSGSVLYVQANDISKLQVQAHL